LFCDLNNPDDDDDCEANALTTRPRAGCQLCRYTYR